MTDMGQSATPTPETPQRGLWRLWRSLAAGGAVGGAVMGVLLVGAVLIKFLSDTLGLGFTVGAIVFGLGIAVAVAALDWLME